MGELKEFFEYVKKLEEEKEQMRKFIKSVMPTLEVVSQMTQDYIQEQNDGK